MLPGVVVRGDWKRCRQRQIGGGAGTNRTQTDIVELVAERHCEVMVSSQFAGDGGESHWLQCGAKQRQKPHSDVSRSNFACDSWGIRRERAACSVRRRVVVVLQGARQVAILIVLMRLLLVADTTG